MHEFQFEMGVDCGNDAFAEGRVGPELARILRQIADRLEQGVQPDEFGEISLGASLRDANGNTVGFWALLIEGGD